MRVVYIKGKSFAASECRLLFRKRALKTSYLTQRSLSKRSALSLLSELFRGIIRGSHPLY